MENKNTWLYYTFGSAFLASLFPIVAADSLKNTPPFLTLTLSLIIASVFFLAICIVKKNTAELKNIAAWKYAGIVGIFNSVLFYGLFYYGLQFTTPGNAALISLTEIGFSFLLFQLWHKESLNLQHIIGIILLIIGAVWILLPNSDGWNKGDIIICGAMAFAPLGNFYQKKGREKVSVFTFLFMRYVSCLPLLGLIVFVLQEPLVIADIKTGFVFIIIMGLTIFGFKNIFWIEAIRRVTVTRVLALHGFDPLFTILLLWVFRDTTPTIAQILSSIPMILGVYLLTHK